MKQNVHSSVKSPEAHNTTKQANHNDGGDRRLAAAFAEIRQRGDIALENIPDGHASTYHAVRDAFKASRKASRKKSGCDFYIFYTKSSMTSARQTGILRCVFGPTRSSNNHKSVFYFIFGVFTRHGLKIDRLADTSLWQHLPEVQQSGLPNITTREIVYISGLTTKRCASKAPKAF